MSRNELHMRSDAYPYSSLPTFLVRSQIPSHILCVVFQTFSDRVKFTTMLWFAGFNPGCQEHHQNAHAANKSQCSQQQHRCDIHFLKSLRLSNVSLFLCSFINNSLLHIMGLRDHHHPHRSSWLPGCSVLCLPILHSHGLCF